jgi:hypothetical protein
VQASKKNRPKEVVAGTSLHQGILGAAGLATSLVKRRGSKATTKSLYVKIRMAGRVVPELGGRSREELIAGVPMKTPGATTQQAGSNDTDLPPVAGPGSALKVKTKNHVSAF